MKNPDPEIPPFPNDNHIRPLMLFYSFSLSIVSNISLFLLKKSMFQFRENDEEKEGPSVSPETAGQRDGRYSVAEATRLKGHVQSLSEEDFPLSPSSSFHFVHCPLCLTPSSSAKAANDPVYRPTYTSHDSFLSFPRRKPWTFYEVLPNDDISKKSKKISFILILFP